jgi:hypothetical protein
MTARIKSITPRTTRIAVMPNSKWAEALLNELLQKEKSMTWTTVTGEKYKGPQMKFQFSLQFNLRHT